MSSRSALSRPNRRRPSTFARPAGRGLLAAPVLGVALGLWLGALATTTRAASDWVTAVQTRRESLASLKADQRAAALKQALVDLGRDFPLETDWAMQDVGGNRSRWLVSEDFPATETGMIERVLGELSASPNALPPGLRDLPRDSTAAASRQRLVFYLNACEQRRAARLRPLLARWSRIVFTKHFNMGGSHYAYTEAQSDAQAERNFEPGAALCVLELSGSRPTMRALIEDANGVIRDPDVSFDGRRILFAWKKSDLQDDYHLYEMDAASGSVRQVTSGLGFADYEGCYLPDGTLLFNSTRCVQTVDCWWTEVSNLYTCDADGRYLRRLTFDQVHDNYPAVLDDGRVVYTRWDYNDRGQIYPQGLFQMNPDGTGQSEFYGNNSWFPTTILHARGIPGTEKVVAILTGHHSRQTGKLAVIDPARGRQENAGVQLVAPVRHTPAERIDAYGQDGELFQYPYPLSETEFLVSYAPLGWQHPRFGLYFMTSDGRREWLASDAKISCNQPVPLASRPVPPARPSAVDYRQDEGIYYMQDIYAGPGLAGVPRGTIKKLRVVALDFRAAGVGDNGSQGPAGGALSSTPVSIGNGAWDPKIVLGEAAVHEDGSALFAVPARTPVYFQAIDGKGRAVQTMRSWSTLQPGEKASCVGCHEAKNSVPPLAPTPQAMQAGVERLNGFYGPPRGFSYPKEIQPIWDRHCVRCHNLPVDFSQSRPGRQLVLTGSGGKDTAFSLRGEEVVDPLAHRKWSESYLALTRSVPQKGGPQNARFTGHTNEWVTWVGVQSVPSMLPPYFAGSTQSGLLTLLEQGHHDVKLSREEFEKISCWIDLLVPFCGDYTEAAAWSDQEYEKYDRFLQKRRGMEAREKQNIAELLGGRLK